METMPVLSPDQLNSPAAIADPYPFYHHLREQSPVNYIHMPGGIFPGIDEPIRAWALMRYDDVYGALRDHDTLRIPQGEMIGIFYGAANRDPRGFPHPDEFRLDRDLRNHVAFGMGIDYCLGAPLARAEAKVTLNTFLNRFPILTRGSAPAVRQTGSPIVFGFQHLPLVPGQGGL